ncbi:MAG: hypothetical protein CL685_03985 [Candidatus Magasanikbacteria bacterium]|nr:hypothetical protein [Candidatus Magasanikbacteria bacterium]|tara:strand:- start:309 stop:1016 length:708 start_codon:yes stop_codon:yes gene_type:complete
MPTKTHSVTSTKLALATASLLIASGLAFIVVPQQEKKNTQPSRSAKRTQQLGTQKMQIETSKTIAQRKFETTISPTQEDNTQNCDPKRQIPNKHGGCTSLCPPNYELSENKEECLGREVIPGSGGSILLSSQAINDPACGPNTTEQLTRIPNDSMPATLWNWKRLCPCNPGYIPGPEENSCIYMCGENALLTETNEELSCTCPLGSDSYLDNQNRTSCCDPGEILSGNQEECIRI